MNKIGLILLFLPCSVFSGWFGPSDYDECILENMKGVTNNNRAVYAIKKSCRNKFQKPQVKQLTQKEKEILKQNILRNYKTTHKELPSSALSKISGTLIAKSSGRYVVVYNGNKDWSINSVNINYFKKELKKNVHISPLSEAEVRVDRSYYDEKGILQFDMPFVSATGQYHK